MIVRMLEAGIEVLQVLKRPRSLLQRAHSLVRRLELHLIYYRGLSVAKRGLFPLKHVILSADHKLLMCLLVMRWQGWWMIRISCNGPFLCNLELIMKVLKFCPAIWLLVQGSFCMKHWKWIRWSRHLILSLWLICLLFCSCSCRCLVYFLFVILKSILRIRILPCRWLASLTWWRGRLSFREARMQLLRYHCTRRD